MLMELLSKAATVAMLSFVVSSMLAMGAGLTVSQISEPLRNARLVVLALLANFVLVPLGAFALAKVLWLDEPFGVGLLVLGCAAGAPFLPKLAELAKGNLAFAVRAMVLLMVVTVGYLPIVLPLLLPGVSVDPWKIARSLVLLMLLPLAAGLALKAVQDLARRVKPVLDWISNVSLILLILLITAANIDKVLQVFGTRGILAGLLFIALGFGIGWLLGGPDADRKRVMALGTGQRNIAAALVVASQSFRDPKVVVMVIVVAIVGLIILMPLSRALGKRRALRRYGKLALALHHPWGVASEPSRYCSLGTAIPAPSLRLVARTGEACAAADDLLLRRLQPDLMDKAPDPGGAWRRVQWLFHCDGSGVASWKSGPGNRQLPFMRRFDGAPMIQPILFKSAIYWLCVLIVRLAEGLVHFLAAGGAIADFPAHLVEHFSWSRFLSIQVWLMVLFLVYVTIHELNMLIGDGELYRLFFRWRSSEAKLLVVSAFACSRGSTD